MMVVQDTIVNQHSFKKGRLRDNILQRRRLRTRLHMRASRSAPRANAAGIFHNLINPPPQLPRQYVSSSDSDHEQQQQGQAQDANNEDAMKSVPDHEQQQQGQQPVAPKARTS